MNILVHNYSNENSTEALYLNTAFNAAGCRSTLWPHHISTFDMFDMTRPDLYITHHKALSMDLVLYLQQASNIDLVINITGLNQQNLTNLEDKLYEYKIKPRLYLVNHYDHDLKSKYSTVMSLLHGADIFFGKGIKQYSIEYAIMVNDKSQLTGFGSTYHYLSNSENLVNNVDICLPIHQMSQLWGNYGAVIFKYFDGTMPQCFYDAAYYNNNIFFDLEDRQLLDSTLSKMFGNGTHCNSEVTQSGDIAHYIKKKHTALHRAKSLLSQFSCKDQIDKLQLLIDQIQ